jgi:hypothetical protein
MALKMDNSEWHIRSLAVRFIKSLLKLYPPRFRHEFYSEIQEVILTRLHDAELRGQWLSAVFQEIAGLVPSIIHERWHELRFRKETIMVIPNEKPRWSFYVGWVGLNLIAVVIAFAIAWILIAQIVKIVGGTIQAGGQTRITEDFLFLKVLFPIIGLSTGIFQHILLRRYLPHMTWWIAATFLGWLMPFIAGYFILKALAYKNDTFSIMLGLLLIGATVVVPQWWLLRQRVYHASWWLLAYGVGWGMVGLLNLVTDHPLPVLLAIALMPAITTGIAWWLLLDWLPNHEGRRGILSL